MDSLKPKATVLIVDDTPENIELLAEYLDEYKIKAASNGTKAISLLEAGLVPHIILLDVIMPDMDGYEVCRRIKKKPELKDIPVIFITAMAEVSDKVLGFQLGAADYITKPFQPEEVRSRIEAHISSSLYRRELQNLNNLLEQKVLERTHELQLAKERAEEAYRIKSHFLSLMSHELRTPMVGILGYSEALMDEVKDPVVREFVQDLNESAARLNDTLESILILTKLESKTVVVRPVKFNIADRINFLLKNHSLGAMLKGLSISFVNSLENTDVCLDIGMFDIIFNNLMSNAIKYTRIGGVGVDLFEEKKDYSEYICLKISDTGIGIPADKLQVIFEEFRQVYEGITRNFEGVGLGLSLVKKYVEEMKGLIEVQSEVGKGSAFIVKFDTNLQMTPLPDVNVETPVSEKKISRPPSARPRFLVVEDDHIIVKVTRLFLEGFIEIDSANDGQSAIKMAQENDYAGILMDINLGKGLSGVDVTKILRGMPKYRDIPIIAFTAFALDGDEKNFISEGCTHYLPKPFSKKKLLDLISGLV